MQCHGTAAARAARLRHSSAVLGKMHDDRPSLNGVRTIMHLAKYETRLAQPVLLRVGDGAAPQCAAPPGRTVMVQGCATDCGVRRRGVDTAAPLGQVRCDHKPTPYQNTISVCTAQPTTPVLPSAVYVSMK